MLGRKILIVLVAVLAAAAVVASGMAVIYSSDLSAMTKERDASSLEKDMSDSLMKLSALIQTELSDMERIALNAASELRGQDLDDSPARGVLSSSVDSNPNIVNAITVDANGIVRAVEPAEFSGFEGTDVSSDPLVSELLTTARSYMSPLATMYQGYGGAVIAAPVLDSNDQVAGMLSVMFRPDHLVENLTAPAGLGSGLNAMVLQKDGIILYDPDSSQVGKDTFTDPLFENFTEIKAAAARMANETYGSARYSFHIPDSVAPISKMVIWSTVGCLGIEWTVAVNRAA